MGRPRSSHVITLTLLLLLAAFLGTGVAQAAPTTPQTAVLGGFYGPAAGSPANDRAYVAEQDSDGWIYVRVVDTSNGSTIALIPIANSANWPSNWYSAADIAGDIVVSAQCR